MAEAKLAFEAATLFRIAALESGCRKVTVPPDAMLKFCQSTTASSVV